MFHFLAMLVVVLLVLIYLFMFKFTVSQYESEHWNIIVNDSIDYNRKQREMTPKSGQYSNTIIWLHDFDSNARAGKRY
jgi:anionic cell wall polymer biosynthesis LytR-Cps2A-Psr (LCP) family protein